MLLPSSQQLPVQDICRHFSLRQARDGDWLSTPGIHLALHPDRSCIAVAHQNEVAVFKLHTPVPENPDAHALCPSTIAASLASHSIDTAQDEKPSLFSSGWASINRVLHRTSSGSSSRRQQQEGSLLGSAATSDADITCIAWIRLQQATADCSLAQQSDLSAATASEEQDGHWFAPGTQNVSELGGGSSTAASVTQQGISGAVLLSGDAAGFIQLHDAQGHAVFRQRLHVQALQHISLRASAQGTITAPTSSSITTISHGSSPAAGIVELTITGMGCVIQVGYQQLLRTWCACEVALAHRHDRQQQQASGSMFSSSMLSWLDDHSAPQIPPLQYQRWDLPRSLHLHGRAVCIGDRAPDLYSLLREPISATNTPMRTVLVAGAKPCLAGVELRPPGGRSTLGAALGAGISLASGLFNAARTAGSTVVNGPAAITQGIKSFVMTPLFPAPRPAKPSPTLLVTHADPAVGLAGPHLPHLASMWGAYHDSPRAITSLTAAPDCTWVAATDNLGRVSLVDAATLMVVRMWKGYRDAQCAWLQLPHDGMAASQHQTTGDRAASPAYTPALVVYAPKCSVVHVWLVPCGTCIASLPTGSHCRLLQTIGGCVSEAGHAHGGMACFLLDGTSGTLTDLTALAYAAVRMMRPHSTTALGT